MSIEADPTKPEQKLSEEFLQTVFMQAGDGIFLINEQGVILEANPRGCEILGYAHDELCGLPVMKLHPADEIDHVIAGLERLAVDKWIVIESVFIRKDGVHIPVEITGRLLSNNYIVGLLRDISERKEAEKALSESEAKFRSLVENSPDGVFLVDEHGKIVEWNHGQEIISGLKRSAVFGKPFWDVWAKLQPEGQHSDTFREHLKEETLEMLEFGEVPGLNRPLEILFQLSDKTYRNVEIMRYTYKTDTGRRMGGVVRDITHRKQIEMLLEYLAMHDALTDLPNRQLFQDRLELALERTKREQHGQQAVMMLDLDNFKPVNDTNGHAYGDELLKVVARRLQSCLRKTDTAARMGGDEFALINEKVADLESCKLIAQKVLDMLAKPIAINGQSFKVTASIGISLCKSESDGATTLLRQADMAMYGAKRLRNRYRVYDPTLHTPD